MHIYRGLAKATTLDWLLGGQPLLHTLEAMPPTQLARRAAEWAVSSDIPGLGGGDLKVRKPPFRLCIYLFGCNIRNICSRAKFADFVRMLLPRGNTFLALSCGCTCSRLRRNPGNFSSYCSFRAHVEVKGFLGVAINSAVVSVLPLRTDGYIAHLTPSSEISAVRS